MQLATRGEQTDSDICSTCQAAKSKVHLALNLFLGASPLWRSEESIRDSRVEEGGQSSFVCFFFAFFFRGGGGKNQKTGRKF